MEIQKTEVNGQLECLICHESFDHLGSHVAHNHHMTAREYKAKFSLDYKFPLISDAVKRKKQIAFEKGRQKYLANLEIGKKYRFKKGHSGTHRISKQSQERYRDQSKEIEENQRGICPVCRMGFSHLASHLYNAHQLQSVK